MTKHKRPIMELIDILGRKWVLRILWELHIQASTFRELQSRCGDLSPTIINKRLKELQESNLVIKSADKGYELSEWGEELIVMFLPFNDFSERWQSARTK